MQDVLCRFVTRVSILVQSAALRITTIAQTYDAREGRSDPEQRCHVEYF